MAGEPVTDVLAEARQRLLAGERVALCQIVRTEGSTAGKVGWKLLVRADGSACGNLGGGAFEALVQTDGAARLRQPQAPAEVKRYYLTEEAVKGEPTGMVCGGLADVFIEVLVPAPLLVVCGGGPVGQALARNGALCGFERLVVEDRDDFRQPSLFPAGTRFAAVGRDYAEPFLDPVAGRRLFVAVVTRCWETDLAAMAGVLRQAPEDLTYLGLMGSQRKVEKVRRELEARGLHLEGLPYHAPIGLPIGGDTPGEIAVSILAEMIKVRSGAEASAAGQTRTAKEEDTAPRRVRAV